ncbi:MAG: hypothetical protein JRN59_07765 [Nitrososphaerota archaeon]|nr:hypothetical protein [Nitrososphaerota archaeon]
MVWDSHLRRIHFRIVGKNHDIVRLSVDGITTNFLVKRGFLEDFLAGRLVEAYALEASDSDEWKSRK